MPKQQDKFLVGLKNSWALIVGITGIVITMSTSIKTANEAYILSKQNEAEINSLKVGQATMKTDIEYIKKTTIRIEDMMSKSYSLAK